MKEIAISLWELTRDEARNMPERTQLLWFNTLTTRKGVDTIGKGCLARDKHCANTVKFFAFEEDAQ